MARSFRFTFILVLAALGTALSAVGGWRFARASAPVNGPIILLSIDTLRADHLPAYGYQKVRTPAIDALAADGTVFERAYSHAPQTLPAHVAILSGRLPFETGVRDNAGFTVRPGDRLLPQMLRDRGFATGGVVSSFALRKDTGLDQGFEFFDDDLPSATDAGAEAVQRDGGESEAIAERWLDDQRSQRVFLFLHLNEPHAPYAPPARYAEYDPYDGEIAYADEIVGRLVRYLKSHQLYDRSTIVLLSDHGEGLGDHGEMEHGLLLYEEAVHVPLIVKQAGGAGAGRRVKELVQHIDLAPTILDLSKAPVPGNLRGRSLKLLLDGGHPADHPPVYSEAMFGRYHFGWNDVSSLTDDRYRYIKASREELYDLRRDPSEKTDADATSAPAVALRKRLDRMMAGIIPAPPVETTDSDRRRLEALGYVGAHLEVPPETGDDVAVDLRDTVEIVESLRRADRLVTSDRLAPGVEILQRLAHDHPSTPEVWRALGDALSIAGRFDQAVHAYQRAAALTPRDAGARLAAASILLRVGRLEEARRDADAALETVRDRPGRSLANAELLRARIAAAGNDPEAAREHAAAGQRADPSLPIVAYVDGLIAYSDTSFDDALEHFHEAERPRQGRTGQVPELHFWAGETLARLARWDEAISEFGAELIETPRSLRARASLATALAAAGRPQEAEQALANLLAIVRTPESYGLAARAWTAAGEPRRAQALKAEARRLFKGDPSLKLLAQTR